MTSLRGICGYSPLFKTLIIMYKVVQLGILTPFLDAVGTE